MAQTGRQGINPYMGRPIPKNKIVRAIQESESMHKAAQSLHVSYNTFKKYATKYDVWKPLPSSAGVSRARKVTWNGRKPLDVEFKFQKQLLKEFILPQRCSHCGYSEKRMSDLMSPLIVHFIDGDINNKKPENLRFYCYNCYFVLSDIKHRPTESQVPRTFEEAQEEITGDELAKELGDSLADLFDKN
jgi:hypothetical protein|tara:strand:- start:296 stop:859 length:564 start_codon:yes stop_codon:yes gene_type:complete